MAEQTEKPGTCFICERRLRQPAEYVNLGFMDLAACSSCVAGEYPDEEQGKEID